MPEIDNILRYFSHGLVMMPMFRELLIAWRLAPISPPIRRHCAINDEQVLEVLVSALPSAEHRIDFHHRVITEFLRLQMQLSQRYRFKLFQKLLDGIINRFRSYAFRPAA